MLSVVQVNLRQLRNEPVLWPCAPINFERTQADKIALRIPLSSNCFVGRAVDLCVCNPYRLTHRNFAQAFSEHLIDDYMHGVWLTFHLFGQRAASLARREQCFRMQTYQTRRVQCRLLARLTIRDEVTHSGTSMYALRRAFNSSISAGSM